MGRAWSVPVILVLLAFLSCLFLVHGLYGLIELCGSPDLSPEATLLIFALCFLVLAAAVAGGGGGGGRRALLLRNGVTGAVSVSVSRGGQALPTTAEEVAMGGELPLLLADEDEMVARSVDLQIEDYPGSGANSRHDPRNPH